jgi:hypothetical protein
MHDTLAVGLLKVSPNLTTLNCEGCSGYLSDATLAACAQHCPLVHTVVLHKCCYLTNSGVRVLVSSLANTLRCVKLQQCCQLSDDAVQAIAEHCPLLEEITCTMNVSDAAVVKLAEGCPELRKVQLQTSEMSDAWLTALATQCPKLKELHLGSCPHVTTKGICTLLRCCSLLKELSLPRHLRGLSLLRPDANVHGVLIFH